MAVAGSSVRVGVALWIPTRCLKQGWVMYICNFSTDSGIRLQSAVHLGNTTYILEEGDMEYLFAKWATEPIVGMAVGNLECCNLDRSEKIS